MYIWYKSGDMCSLLWRVEHAIVFLQAGVPLMIEVLSLITPALAPGVRISVDDLSFCGG
jgi:hypothetical protein